jgi:hypothetical protein
MSYFIVLDSSFSDYSEDLEYSFEPLVQTKEDGRTRSFTTISNQDPEAARHFGFQPGQSNPRIEWIIYNNGEDKSNGTYGNSNINDSRISNDTVKSVEEQIIWLTEYIMDNTSDPRWTLFGGRFSDRDGDGIDEGTRVAAQELNHTRVAGSTKVEAQIKLKLGVTI